MSFSCFTCKMAVLLCISPIAVVSSVQKCCLLTLIARCLLYSPATSCLWYSIIILCMLQRREERMHLLSLCFSTRIYFTSALSLSSLSTGLLCVFIVTSKWPSPPRSLQNPHPSFQSGDQRDRETQREEGNYTYFPDSNTIPAMLSTV